MIAVLERDCPVRVKAEIVRFVEGAGFRVESVEPQGGYFWLSGDLLQAMHRYVFSNKRSLIWRILFVPFEILSKVFFSVLVPWVCYHLDRFDRKRTYTTGFECVAIRAEDSET